jgi:hypothetical protein
VGTTYLPVQTIAWHSSKVKTGHVVTKFIENLLKILGSLNHTYHPNSHAIPTRQKQTRCNAERTGGFVCTFLMSIKRKTYSFRGLNVHVHPHLVIYVYEYSN